VGAFPQLLQRLADAFLITLNRQHVVAATILHNLTRGLHLRVQGVEHAGFAAQIRAGQ
jgi:hypothetical protein